MGEGREGTVVFMALGSRVRGNDGRARGNDGERDAGGAFPESFPHANCRQMRDQGKAKHADSAIWARGAMTINA